METSHHSRSVFDLMKRGATEAERHLIQKPHGLTYRPGSERPDPPR